MTALNTDKLRTALEAGEFDLKGQFLLGSNYTFLVTVRHEGGEYPAVYKPARGEQPLWDFPEASLAGREVAAYLVSEALGFGFVPLTVLRDGPFGPGSLQQFIDYNPNYHYFNFSPQDRLRLRPVALFDLLVNNADRKGSHMIIQKRTRRLYGIDHGLCFHAQDKLRTVIWDFAGEEVGEDLLSALVAFRAALAANPLAGLRKTRPGNSGKALGLRPALGVYLTPSELAALESRAEALLAVRRFPSPPESRRAYPYPPL